MPGKEIVRDLLERTILWSEIITSRYVPSIPRIIKYTPHIKTDTNNNRQGMMDARFKDSFDSLANIRNQLEKLSLTQAWSLRETDLYSYQRKLDNADAARVDGNFVCADGRPADLYEQRVRPLLRTTTSRVISSTARG